MGAVSDFIEQSKQISAKVSPAHKALQELIQSFSEQEIKNSFIAALEDKFFKDITQENITSTSFSSESASIPQEICMELGQDDGFTEQEMRDYIYKTCTLLPQEVRKVRVLNKKTFISIPENRLSSCIDAMRSAPITKKHHKIYVVEDIRRERKDRWDEPKKHHFKRGGRRDRKPNMSRYKRR
jgi:hypothetical protein